MDYLDLIKDQLGNVVDMNGNIYTIKSSNFTSGYDALFCNGNQLDFWHELPLRVRNLFNN